MTSEQRKLRNRLRERSRALGDTRDDRAGTQRVDRLVEDVAYEQWHRLLFTRFLAENNLLHTDEENHSVPVTLEECEALAPELGARDGFDLACRFASRTLPGVFRRNDPVLDLRLAPNDEVALRKLLDSLPAEVFRSDDALGWTYQFWQAKRKDEVNASGKKIGPDELPAVTQLFTEDYMVEFLLHNTLGAWWAGKLGPTRADSEEEARSRASLSASNGAPGVSWTYLRFVQNEETKTWLPAAGRFSGWPTSARLIRLLDPCMGSGHFLVFALPILIRLRMEEEHLSAVDAVVAVLRDNLHGLEIDERCTQIAAFNVALTAWKIAGYQTLPSLHLACSGHAPSATEAEWVALAGPGKKNDRLQRGMARLHSLFKDAPVLGSLINPRAETGSLIDADFTELAPLLDKALATSEKQKKDDDNANELAVVAQGIAKAAELLASEFTLVITNVPYLGRGKQHERLKDYCERVYPDAKANLATCFVERCLDFCSENTGVTSLVTPQNWLFQAEYRIVREALLENRTWHVVSRLGAGAFEGIDGEVVNVTLVVLSAKLHRLSGTFWGIDLSDVRSPGPKAHELQVAHGALFRQDAQRTNPGSRIMLVQMSSYQRLSDSAASFQGIKTGDDQRVVRRFWEVGEVSSSWEFYQGSVLTTRLFGGMESILWWADAGQGLARKQGIGAWSRNGVLVSQMGRLPATLYMGTPFDSNGSALVVSDAALVPPLWSYCSSSEYAVEVRRIDQSLKPTNSSLCDVPFDFERWSAVAAEEYPNGLPKPYSPDPTQWIFSGRPKSSVQPLHVAVARLLGYRWPRQTGRSFPGCPALSADGLEGYCDNDGIVCLPALNREQTAAVRLRQLLAAALGNLDERGLIGDAGLNRGKSKTLEEWLRDEFFEQHIRLFHERPFIWHIWDGRSDGFHALLNYHRLDYSLLQKLTFTYLGSWIQQQSNDAIDNKPGAAERLGAAQRLQSKLAAILEGENPLDIFVRWKPLHQQPVGWNPDLNDGIRQNIRPFLVVGDIGKKGAGLFRTVPLVLKEKDRGAESQRSKADYPWFWGADEPPVDFMGGRTFTGYRWNNAHYSLTVKKRARVDVGASA